MRFNKQHRVIIVLFLNRENMRLASCVSLTPKTDRVPRQRSLRLTNYIKNYMLPKGFGRMARVAIALKLWF